jgi:4-amino-4-deoxy-L-arabinose transferase-like glycosyltransferase
MLLWFALPFIVFSLIGSKRINYLPPILPPLAILLAEGLAAGRSPLVTRLLPWLMRVVLGVLALAIIAPWLGIQVEGAPLPVAATMGIGIGALVALLAHELARRRIRRARADAAPSAASLISVIALAIALAIAFPCASHVAGSMGRSLTTHRFAAFAALPYVQRGVPLIAFHLEVSSLGFYLEGRTAILVGSPRQVHFEDPEVLSRLYYPDKSDEERARFDRFLAASRELIFVLKEKTIPSLEKRAGAPLEIIHQDEHFTVVRMIR